MRPENYTLVFEDNFLDCELNENNWLRQQPWGVIHPKGPHQYYDKDSVHVTDEGLILDQKYKPKEIEHWDGTKYHPDYAVGLVSSKQSFGYGWYEFEAQLPTGRGLWPAIWMASFDSWPPEIDLLEGYTTNSKRYNIFPFFFKRRVKTNVYYRESPDFPVKNVKGKSHWMWKDPSNYFLNYACHWEKDFIRFYYDGNLVRTIDDPRILNTFNSKMYIILNNAVDPEYKYSISPFQLSEFKVRSVKVYQNV